MSKIRSKNTTVEKLVFYELNKRQIYYKKHCSKVIGNPDIVLLRKKRAIFIDGDFWHGYNSNILLNRLPKKYWVAKIKKNRERDKKVNRMLKKTNWKVLRIWEHELLDNFDNSIKKIISFLTST